MTDWDKIPDPPADPNAFRANFVWVIKFMAIYFWHRKSCWERAEIMTKATQAREEG